MQQGVAPPPRLTDFFYFMVSKIKDALFFVCIVGVVSLVSLSLLSYERHSALFSSIQSYSSQYRRARLAVAVSWLYSLAWTLPPLLGWSRSKPNTLN